MNNSDNRKRERVRRFVTRDLWEIDTKGMPAIQSVGIKSLRAVFLMFKGFRDDECSLHASALTLSSLMAIVPILALSLALARGFGGADTAKATIKAVVSKWTGTFQTVSTLPIGAARQAAEESGDLSENKSHYDIELASQIDHVLDKALDRVDAINFKTLGSVGLIFLLLMVTQMLGQVEQSFNRVWGVTKSRSMWRKFTDYLSVLVVLPLLIVAASSIPVADIAMRHIEKGQLDSLKALLSSDLFKIVSVLIMTSVAFTFFIMFMPNTAVKIKPALFGGVFTAILFIIWLKICAALQVGVAGYGRIYGGFAIVPIILAWVYVSWQIILFGAEAAFAVQNCSTYGMEQGSWKASPHSRILLTLSLVLEAARSMRGETAEFNVETFARERRIPIRFINEVLSDLSTGGLIAEVAERSGRYVLLKAPETLKIADIIKGQLEFGTSPDDLGMKNIDTRVQKVMDRLSLGIKGSLNDMTLADMLNNNIHPAQLVL